MKLRTFNLANIKRIDDKTFNDIVDIVENEKKRRVSSKKMDKEHKR